MYDDYEYMDRQRSKYPRVSGDRHNGLATPHYEYGGSGHDSVDPMNCNCGDSTCLARREAARLRGLKRKANREYKSATSQNQ